MGIFGRFKLVICLPRENRSGRYVYKEYWGAGKETKKEARMEAVSHMALSALTPSGQRPSLGCSHFLSVQSGVS